MKSTINLLILSLTVLSITFSSCKKEPGCMDPDAMSYNFEAQKEDGSCVYSHSLSLGIWNVNPDCEELNVLGQTIALDEQLPESIEILGEGTTTLFIDIDGTVVTGEIDVAGNITVEKQTISIDPGLGVPLDVDIEGDGAVNLDSTGVMDLTYSFEIPIVGSQSVDCAIILSK